MKPMKILLLEDNLMDAELVRNVLIKSNLNFELLLCGNEEQFTDGLNLFQPELILCDNSLPQFDGSSALQMVTERGLLTPFILVTGTVSEDFAVSIMKKGADDYILKDRLARLPIAIDAAVKSRKKEKERIDAIAMMKNSEENLKAIFENTSEGFVLLDMEGLVLEFNTKAQQSLLRNMSEDIIVGKSIFDFVDKGRKDFYSKMLQRVFNGGVFQYDRSFTGPDDIIFWINFSLTPVMKSGIQTGICIMGRDITERKLVEQQREFDHNNLNALINNTNDLLWSVSTDFRLITSNEAFDKMVMHFSGKMPNHKTNILDYSTSVEQAKCYNERYNRAFAGKSFSVIEHHLTPTEVWSEISFYPIYEKELVVGTACFSRDITQRMKYESVIEESTENLKSSLATQENMAIRMGAILNTLPASIALLDSKGNILEVNNSWAHFAKENGFVGDGAGLGNNYIVVSAKSRGVDYQDGKKVASGIKSVLANKLSKFEFEYACHSPQQERWFRVLASPLITLQLAGAVVMHIDVSEIKKLERERLSTKLNQQKEITRAMLQGQEQERDQLGRELHDNISQLLAVVGMKLSYCLTHYQKGKHIVEECQGHLREAMVETRNLSHRMVTPRFSEHIFKRSLETLASYYQTDTRAIKLLVDHVEEGNMTAALKQTLFRIIQEQLNNINKYAKASSVTIDITETEDSVNLIIEDNGVGFDLTKKIKGIGLSNIQNRVEFYNGTSSITTSPGNGFNLNIVIPNTEVHNTQV